MGVFLTELHQQLHARSCIHFQWFPHTRYALETKFYFVALSRFCFFICWGEPLGPWFHGATVRSFVSVLKKVSKQHTRFLSSLSF